MWTSMMDHFPPLDSKIELVSLGPSPIRLWKYLLLNSIIGLELVIMKPSPSSGQNEPSFTLGYVGNARLIGL